MSSAKTKKPTPSISTSCDYSQQFVKLEKKIDDLCQAVSSMTAICADLSNKYDIFMFNVGSKLPATEVEEKKQAKKPPVKKTGKSSGAMANIMALFRAKYIENQGHWNELLTTADDDGNTITGAQFKEKVFSEHAEELKKKSGAGRIICENAILYKALNNRQKDKLREILAIENGSKQEPKEELIKDAESEKETESEIVEEDDD